MARGAAGPAAPGSGGHGDTTGVRGGPGTPPVPGAGCRPGRRVPPVRLRHGQRADAERLGDATARPGSSSRSRARRSHVEAFQQRLRRGATAAGRRRGRRPPSTWRPVAAPVSPSARPTADRAGRTLASPDVATCARLPARAGRPRRPAPPAPVHHLHELRPALHHHHSAALRPRRRPRWRGFRCAPAAPREYADPADRRFHAQPIACHDCGPTLELVDAAGRRTTREDALAGARGAARRRRRPRRQGPRRLPPGLRRHRRGRRGRRCAQRKRRGDKPFAVMVGDVATARRLTVLDPVPRRLLAGPRRPVVLLPGAAARRSRRPSPRATPTSACCCPTPRCTTCCSGCPATRRDPAVLVMTSGNLVRRADRHRRRRGAGRGWRGSPTPGSRHDRPIHVPCDDSVVRVVDGERAAGPPLARLRAAAARPAGRRCRPALAVGGDLKNTFCLGEGRHAWLSAHIGDMDDLATLRAFDAPRAHLSALTGVAPGRARGRPAPRLPLHRAGPRGTRRDAPAAHGPAPPRAHRRGDGRARAGRRRAGDRRRLRRHRVRRRRRGLGRRGPARRLRRLHAGPRTWPTCRCPAATPACAGPYRMALAHLRAAGSGVGRRPALRARPARRTSARVLAAAAGAPA